jgi:hypothetical protein
MPCSQGKRPWASFQTTQEAQGASSEASSGLNWQVMSAEARQMRLQQDQKDFSVDAEAEINAATR